MWFESQGLNSLCRGEGLAKEKAQGLKLSPSQLSGWIELSSKSVCVCVCVCIQYLGNSGYVLHKSLEVWTQCGNTVSFLLQDTKETDAGCFFLGRARLEGSWTMCLTRPSLIRIADFLLNIFLQENTETWVLRWPASEVISVFMVSFNCWVLATSLYLHSPCLHKAASPYKEEGNFKSHKCPKLMCFVDLKTYKNNTVLFYKVCYREQTNKSFLLFVLFFLALQVQHMEVPRLGVESELKLLATATLDLSHVCNLCHSSGQWWILNPLSKAGNQTWIPIDNSWVHNPPSHSGNSLISCIYYFFSLSSDQSCRRINIHWH